MTWSLTLDLSSLPAKFEFCLRRARQERPPLAVLVAMTSLYLLIPPEWIAMRNDVQHTFSAWKVPYQFSPHIFGSLWQAWCCCLDSWCAFDLWLWRFSNSYQLMAIKETFFHSTSSLKGGKYFFQIFWCRQVEKKLGKWSSGNFGFMKRSLEIWNDISFEEWKRFKCQ